jgi:hypothetical protein
LHGDDPLADHFALPLRPVLGPHLVAMGSFMSADPTRIIAKRIILTGHPFKVHRKTATVRYMFFNRGQSPAYIMTKSKLEGVSISIVLIRGVLWGLFTFVFTLTL